MFLFCLKPAAPFSQTNMRSFLIYSHHIYVHFGDKTTEKLTGIENFVKLDMTFVR